MNDRIKSLYVAIIDNEVVCFDTNLKLFVEQFIQLVPESRNYQWYYRQFQASTKFSCEFAGNKVYYFQRVV